jgi:hypothetical protein
MKDMKRPAGPEADRKPGAADIAKFGAALLGALGVGSLVDFFRKRATMKQQEHETQRRAEAERSREEQRRVGHEVGDVRIRNVVLVLGAMLVAAVVINLGLGAFFALLNDRATAVDVPASPLSRTEQLPPAPRLQVAPADDLARLRTAEQQRLNSYDWVDRNAGVVRIPIDRAMALIAERGLPTRGGNAAGQPAQATAQPTSVPGTGQNVPAATAAP